jgi:pimeloyl-ACP methyl ester carboxylesterase
MKSGGRRKKRLPLVRGLVQTGMDWGYVCLRQGERFVLRDSPERYRRPADGGEGLTRPPVIFIPGVYEPWEYMKPLIELAHAWKHPVHVIEGLGYNTGNIPHMAELARRFIDDRHIHGAVIIAHSKGGLIGKYLLANYNEDGRVRHLIALNTPFGGSLYAMLSPLRTMRAFSPEDRLIRELAANRDINSHITSIYASFDQQIPDGSWLEGATDIEIKTIGHFRIVNHPEAHQAILDTLTALRFEKE